MQMKKEKDQLFEKEVKKRKTYLLTTTTRVAIVIILSDFQA